MTESHEFFSEKFSKKHKTSTLEFAEIQYGEKVYKFFSPISSRYVSRQKADFALCRRRRRPRLNSTHRAHKTTSSTNDEKRPRALPRQGKWILRASYPAHIKF